MSDNSDLISVMNGMLEADWKRQKRLQKTDDIIEFIAANWRLFTCSRAQMKQAVDSLGMRGTTYSVDSLCDLLGVPPYVFFKRSPVKDVGAAILNFKRSKLYELFEKCSLSMNSNSHLACLFVVAGTKSIVITNMQTTIPENGLVCYVPSASGYDIHIFRADEAHLRLPNLFNPKEDSYD